MRTKSDEGDDLRYAGFGLVIGLGVGAVIAVLLEAPFYYAGVGAMIGLIAGVTADSYTNSGE
ncbi:hypothetical protein AKJ37_04940 [candidate division MSBL1 archaeon SCGC-AAA259I09]|uniref:Uncharacterized protein n=2 Tax=candidate division MSBL1 TaxID=215777 RepID=A0A133UQP7_9EURY|nr:hypothetical protein AKJ61_02290 [candidate division MSBL1 archaeon SCGC-AAA259B11]KXA96564.1 hypothetical protein AKJ37_04940 [candidate division MSBL1 archaeon SCGC-AAA259I09]